MNREEHWRSTRKDGDWEDDNDATNDWAEPPRRADIETLKPRSSSVPSSVCWGTTHAIIIVLDYCTCPGHVLKGC